MKQKYIQAYMDVAERFGQLSSAQRLKVGAIVVKDDRIISIGYNGTPPGWDNDCEYRDYNFSQDINGKPFPHDSDTYPYVDENNGFSFRLVTKPEVLHAEANALAKLCKHNESSMHSTLFVTHQPCMECAKMIYTAGIKTVYFKHPYRLSAGLDFLKKTGIEINQI